MNNELAIAPHDEQLERAVLGAVLIGGPFDEVAEVLTGEDFYFRKHQAIYSAMLTLRKQAEVIDYLTVGNELLRGGVLESVGGNSYLAELVADVVSWACLASHANAIKELSRLRALRRIGQELTRQSEERTDSNEVAHEAERRLFSTMWAAQVRPWQAGDQVISQALDHVECMQKRQGQITGIPVGLREVDALLGGWQRSDLVIVAARTGMGKTAFLCGAALAAIHHQAKVAIVTLEMSTRQLGIRLMAQAAHLNVFDVMHGRLTSAGQWHLANTAQQVDWGKVMMDEAESGTLDKIRAKARQLKVRSGLDVLFVDYLQLMDGGKRRDNRQVEVSEISRGLKLLAKELDVTVVALSQLSRKCEEREDKRPILSDLRESGSIEQDADIVLMLYRDDVYYPDSVDKGTAEVLIKKHRNGPLGDVRVAWNAASARFSDLNQPTTGGI